MESDARPPSHDDATAALRAAEASRAAMAGRMATPAWFSASLGAAIAVHLAAIGIGVGRGSSWAIAAGLLVVAVAAIAQVLRFRRLNGVWMGDVVSRVVLGTDPLASISYAIALCTTIWAATTDAWALVGLASVAGGAAYALSGHRWLRRARADLRSDRGPRSATWLAAASAAAVAGIAVLAALA